MSRRLARAVAATGLQGSGLALPTEPLDDDEWRGLRAHVAAERLHGLLYEAVRTGALPVTDDQREDAAVAHVDAMSSVLVLDRALLVAVEALAAADVDHRVLKGSANAHLDYPDPALRVFGDVDLLVRADQFERAAATLVDLGHRRRFPEPAPGFDARFSKGTSFVTAGSVEIDLHRTFVLGPFGLTVDLDDLWATDEPFVVGDTKVMGLDRTRRLLNACYHAGLGNAPARLQPLRDVAQIALSPALDAEAVLELARGWRGEAAVARAIRLAWEAFEIADTTRLSAWAAGYRTSAGDQRLLDVYLTADQSFAGKAFASVRVLPGMRNKVDYIRALAWPQGSYLDGRYPSRRDRLRHGVRAVLRRRNGRRVG